MNKLSKLILTMMKIGIIGFGGGNALIPVIEKSVVEDEKLITPEEYEEDILIANITPGALPVEIAGGIGKRVCGKLGMLLCAMAMAFPGVCLTLLMLTAMSQLNEDVLLQIEYLAVGITAFIACLLTSYIVGTVKNAKERGEIGSNIIVIAGVLILTCGKNLYRVIGIDSTPLFGLATIDIFIMAFFVIIYTRCKFTRLNAIVSVTLCILYILNSGKSHVIESDVIGVLIRITMVLLALYGLKLDLVKKSGTTKKPWKEIFSGLSILSIAIVITLIPSVMITDNSWHYIGNGLLSSIMSFGGGDAYLTVADGLFVGTGLVTEDEFYSCLVPVVNILPGSILCKTLSGIGYYIGYYATGNILQGLVVAAAGFVASVAASCGVFHAMGGIYKSFENLNVFQGIKKWIRPIVAGLMFTVMLSLIYQNCKLGISVGSRNTPILYMLGIYVVDLFLYFKLKMNNSLIVLLSAIISFALCNLFLLN